MSRDEVLTVLSKHREEIEAIGVKSLAIFGSVARDEAGASSDIDVLVEFNPPATYDAYLRLKSLLEKVVGRHVDLVTRRALKPRMRPVVEKEAVYVP